MLMSFLPIIKRPEFMKKKHGLEANAWRRNPDDHGNRRHEVRGTVVE